MKQHITIEQLRELSRDAFETYQGSFTIELGDVLVIWDFPNELKVFDGKGFEVTGSVSKLVTLGQMIEFLDEHADKLNDYGNSIEGTPTIMFHYYKNVAGIDTEQLIYLGWENELCDDLWEAVKEVLITP